MRKSLCGRGERPLDLVRKRVRPPHGIADQAAVRFRSRVIRLLGGVRVACVRLIRCRRPSPAFLLEQRVDDVVQDQRDILERLPLGWHGVLSHRATELVDGSIEPQPELGWSRSIAAGPELVRQ